MHDYIILSKISLLPHLEEDERRSFLESLTRELDNPGDILNDENDYSGIEELKEIM